MEVENLIDKVIEDEEPVVQHLVRTTRERAVLYCQSFKKLPLKDTYFVSGTFPDNYTVGNRGKTKHYVAYKQILQYRWINFLLEQQNWTDVNKLIVIYEQTFKGNVHYHMLVNTTMHRHDFRALLAEIFKFKRAQDILINVDIQQVNNIDNVVKYLFNKTTKTYECLDMEIYKPLIL